MDSEAVDKITDEVADDIESKGFDQAVNDVLNRNKALKESATWQGATTEQKRQIRRRMTSDARTESVKITPSSSDESKTFINVRGDNYRKLTRNEDVLKDSEGNLYLRDEKGRIKEIIE